MPSALASFLQERRWISLAVAAGPADALAQGFADKGIAFTADLHSAVVAGDRKRLEQVVVNLLTNALRYTDAGRPREP